MDIEHANDHPFKVAVVGNDNEMYANSHPYKVSIVEGGSSFVTELPETGTPGTMYVLVDDVENPTKAYGIYTYNNGWVLVSQPVDQAVKKVDELPEVGEEGVLYYLAKEGDDTYDLYRWIDNTWIKVDTDIQLYNSEGNNTDGAMTQAATTALKGKAKELTSADYNYPTSNPDGVALWLLEPGVYVTREIKVYPSTDIYDTSPAIYTVGVPRESDNIMPIVKDWAAGSNVGVNWYAVRKTNGGRVANRALPSVVQTTGTSTADVMSQAAVTRFLRSTYTSGSIGVTYDTEVAVPIANSGTYNSSTGKSVILSPGWMYGCGMSNVIIGDSEPGPSSYKPNLVHSISIGSRAHADYNGSIALGPYSQTSAVGEMNIGSTDARYGYNSSNYRLLTGLYDPQSAHDAATKGYVDTAVAGAGGTNLTNAEFNTIFDTDLMEES